MKTTKIVYYVTTALISASMAFSTYAYLSKPELKDAFQHLKLPDYFRIELAIAKLLASMAIWLPIRLAREAAYVGLTISFVSAVIAHIAVNDSIGHILYPVFVQAILIASYLTYPGSQIHKSN